MKKILLLVTVTIILFSCNNLADSEYIISGNIKGMKNGLVFLGKQSPTLMGVETIDTVKIVDGKFEIKGKISEPEIHFIHIDKTNGKVPFILEGGEIEIEIDKDSISKSKSSGTYNNDEFFKFNEESGKIQKKLQKKVMDFQMKNMAKISQAQKENDTITLNALKNEFDIIQKDMNDFMFSYPKTHPKSFISALITEMMFTNKKIKLKDIEAIYNSFDESLKKTKPGKSIKESIYALKKEDNAKKNIIVGKTAPDFKAPNPEGKMVSLKESLGEITLVDFWASWCQPCRAENPNVVALYNDYHAKGLNIISVSLDDETSKWKAAIAKDKLSWIHVSNLKGFKDPIAMQYGISQIPSTFLLDKSGKIVAIDLRGDALKSKINELLTVK